MAIRYLDKQQEEAPAAKATGGIRYLDDAPRIAQGAPEPMQDESRALGERLASGLSFGLSDAVSPYTAALATKAYDTISGRGLTEGESIQDLAQVAQGRLQQRRSDVRQQNPVAAYGLEIAGSLPASGAVFGGASKLAQLANLGRAAKPAALAASGAVEAGAFSEAKTLDGFVSDVARGAVVAPLAAKGIEKIAPMTGQLVSKFSQTAVAPVKEIMGSIFKANPVAARQFMEEGVPLSALAVSDNPVVNRIGSILSGTLGSTGIISKSAKETIGAIENKLASLSTNPNITLQRAGEVAQQGITGHIDKFKSVASALYDDVGKAMAGKKTALASTKNFVSQQLSQFADAPNLSAKIQSNRSVMDAMAAIEDAGEAGLSYSALKRYRTEIGSTITQNAITGVDNGVAKAAYAALSDDMRNLAASSGQKALRKFERANAFYANGVANIENRLAKYVGTRADPASIITAIKSSSKSSDFKVGAIMKAIPAQDRPFIRDAIMQQMGRGGNGEFSPARFFSDYSKISPEAKRVLFGADGAQLRKSLDNLSGISKRLSEVSKFENFSNSANNISNLGLFALTASNLSAGAGVAVGSNLSARLLTNEKFATTLAQYAAKPITPTNVSKFMNKLGELAVKNPEISSAISAYIGLLSATSATLIGGEE